MMVFAIHQHESATVYIMEFYMALLQGIIKRSLQTSNNMLLLLLFRLFSHV